MIREKLYIIKQDKSFFSGIGTNDYETAVKLLKLQKRGLMVVIDENTGNCVEEITFEELFN